jgi:hypothetical protein
MGLASYRAGISQARLFGAAARRIRIREPLLSAVGAHDPPHRHPLLPLAPEDRGNLNPNHAVGSIGCFCDSQAGQALLQPLPDASLCRTCWFLVVF